ncbi:MAG: penicillin-binding transpeptidase domain-containing protein [Kiritimatiellia bacterium]|jgi:peptidoglycan glycosyltransferase|nr:penicillin-binding transpeptidase domain-containing protein [Kiritimatiellia bacterium]
MLETVMEFLNGPLGRECFRLNRALFLVLLTLAALALWRAPAARPGKVGFGLLRGLTAGALLASLIYQATWQISGFLKPEFVRFLRRYNKRPRAAEMQVMRGPLLDRRGRVLAAPVSGDVWGRRYPLGEAGVHPLGYYHSQFGITAVERVCDPELSGYPAERREGFPGAALFALRAEEGRAVTLTLDARLQERAYDLLAGRKGAVIMMRPRSGDLLALVSSPGFDPRDPGPASRDEENAPVFNRATQGRYPPGSVFKILVAAAALDKGLAPIYSCPAMGYIAGPDTPPIRDSEYYAYARRGAVWPGWGRLNLEQALAHSSNVYFAQLGVACGTDVFHAMTARAQINAPLVYLQTSSGELRSAAGNAPDVTRPRKLAMLAIGQGDLLATPLHVACFTAAVAAGGEMPRPRLRADEAPGRLGALCSPHAAERLATMLRAAVRDGTGRGADVPGLEVCGKTGTAQAPGGDDHAWFTCFAPRRAPRLVVTVLVERGGFGARTALPVARALLEDAVRLGLTRPEGEGES